MVPFEMSVRMAILRRASCAVGVAAGQTWEWI